MTRASYAVLLASIAISILCLIFLLLSDSLQCTSSKIPQVLKPKIFELAAKGDKPTGVPSKVTEYDNNYEERFDREYTEVKLEGMNFLSTQEPRESEQMSSTQGDICQGGGRREVCKKLSDCPSAQSAIRAGRHPKICSFVGLLPIVCCPQEQLPTFQEVTTEGGINENKWQTERWPQPTQPTKRPQSSKAWDMCLKYAEFVYKVIENPVLLAGGSEYVKEPQCFFDSQTLIIGGKNASPSEFPHMAHIGYGEEPRVSFHCGGSLISERFVLSAAHCTKTSKGLAKWVRLGDLNIISNEDGLKPVILRITQRFTHPSYDSVKLYDDIALYKLERNVELRPEIRPLCLHTDLSIPKEHAIATGWGVTSWGGSSSAILKKVSLKLIDSPSCNASFRGNIGRQLPNGIVENQMVCAGGEVGKDACQGDSGGPLQYALTNPFCMYSQVGVTSFGKACGQNTPGVYTRVSNYVPWIESIVWP